MCRFYGWSDDYVESLDIRTFIDYWNAVTVIEARERLVDLNVAMIPHAEDKDRKKFYKELEKKAYPVRKSTGKKLTNKELMDILSRR
ncbi:MAG TPA: hypothetical protein PK522_00975 [Nitrosomonas sp.]|nr:hypothetical protein [Nitrosomonas sp.]